MRNLVTPFFHEADGPDTPPEEFATYGTEIMDSEELTDRIYSSYLNMMVEGWAGPSDSTKKEFQLSDIGLIYKAGPYIPCVKRVSFTQHVDLVSDGLPGIRCVGGLNPADSSVALIRPVKRMPNEIQVLGRCLRKYKLVAMWPMKDDPKKMDSLVLWFGIGRDGQVLSAYNKRMTRPERWHGAAQFYPSMAMNAWADQKYHWLANTSEDVGVGILKLRLGLSKEHIKSLFYARSLPVTDTGRKRPILHWVRSHKRRIKEGIEIDIDHHLRGITQVEMDGLRLEITQPNKAALHLAEPQTVTEAFKMYAEEAKQA